jgi:hypothetical protein
MWNWNLDINNLKNQFKFFREILTSWTFLKSWHGTRELNFISKLINLLICCRTLYLLCIPNFNLIWCKYSYLYIMQSWKMCDVFCNGIRQPDSQIGSKSSSILKKKVPIIYVFVLLYTHGHIRLTLTCPTLHLTRMKLIVYWDGAQPN